MDGAALPLLANAQACVLLVLNWSVLLEPFGSGHKGNFVRSPAFVGRIAHDVNQDEFYAEVQHALADDGLGKDP